MSLQDISAFSGLHPVTTSKVLALLQQEEVIGEFNKNFVDILDYERFLFLAQSVGKIEN